MLTGLKYVTQVHVFNRPPTAVFSTVTRLLSRIASQKCRAPVWTFWISNCSADRNLKTSTSQGSA